MSTNHNNNKMAIDPAILWPAVMMILATSIPLAIYPEAGKAIVGDLLGWFTGQFGWLYLLSGIGSFFFMCWLAYGPVGKIKLGAPEDKPEFNKASWIAMLFCAGIGISICNWAFVEPLYFLSSPPLGVAPNTHAAAEWAAMYPMFHWGVVPWALYLMPALPIGYALYVRKVHVLRLSEACRGVLGDLVDGPLGKIIDIVVIFSIVGGVGTSLGLSVPLVSELFQEMFGLEDSFGLQMFILAAWIAMIAWSVYNGLNKGIQTLSNINAVLAFLLLAFVLVAGSTVFLLNLWSNSFGLFMDNFFRINFWTDPIDKGGFPEGWTMFYWAWWIAYAPMMGLFVARVSRGRTIKELIVNGVVWGSIGCWAFFAIWGGYAIDLSVNNGVDLQGILSSQGIPATVVAVLQQLPGTELLIPVFTLLCFVFLATTVDSSAYMLAAICTKEITGYQEPARWNRILWTLLLAMVGIGLLSVGGLKAVQTSTILVALPMIPVLFIMGASLLRWAYEDFGADLAPHAIARCQVKGENVKVCTYEGAVNKASS
ncbi:BCCT family transporter [Marinobacterium sediminicola]|uniref:Betaine/carnitine transporter, BCCT family n=1 Tax=Marinobacterium sediminicola TaxID=518898 RepID=A0ABY1RYU3_9GAMM|nr:BCCT family transporter [Marinobacterium sediminicola]ULG68021.1 BCCT family transporter [Marinobacterium sediminicola]SMR73469.1 betaine/carnitine transporter, BCCT family [Marinobacterium sediminicola]